MSQVMENPANGSLSNSRSPETVFSAPEQQQGFDIIKVLWRWKWLPILGAMIGTGVGYLYFSKQPAQYQASALVQVVDSLPPSARIQVYDPNEIAKYSRADESMVIRSQRVLKMAVEKGQLIDQPALKGASADQIAAMLAGPNLVVQPAAKDANTTLLQISYVCNDADLAAAVVNAIVIGYGDYLSEEYRTVGNEIYDLVNKAQDKLTARYKELNEKNMEFRRNAPNVVWSGNDFSDPYAEAYNSLNSDIRGLQSKREVIAATLQQIDIARKAGRPAQAILLMLTDQNSDTLFAGVRNEKSAAPSLTFASTDTESSQMQKTELIPLQMSERELSGKVGDNHPKLAAVRERIQILQEHIARLAQSERVELARRDELMKQAEEEAKKNGGTTVGISMEQQVAIREQALIEQMASIELQLKGLNLLAQKNLEKSKEHTKVLSSNSYLNNELQSIQQMLDLYTEKLNAMDLLPQGSQRTLKELNLPSTGYFYGPKLTPYLLGGAAIGFLILSGLAVLMDLADRSYRNPDEIASDLNMPVLGHIPVMEVTKVKKVYEAADASLTTLHHSRGRVSEAYRAVRTGLFFSNRGSELKVIQVTSPVPGDGKSTLSANLAVTMAQSGRRVLLIDADFRRPRIAKIFGIDADIGMAAVVAEKAELDDAIYASPVANLSIMPGGKRPSNPAELLSSPRFKELMEVLRGKFDIIIVDTPPLLAVSDPGAVAAVVDGVVLTMRLRRNVKPLATRATRILESVDACLLGVVVNGVSAEAGYGYSYGYNDYRYAYRYGSNYRYGYGGKYGYANRYGYGSGYLEEAHDVEQGPASPADPNEKV